MHRRFTSFIILILGSFTVGAQVEVIPNNYAATAGTASFTGPFTTAGRTYQLLMHQSLLTNLVGMELTGLAFRASSGGSGSWPTASTTVTNYDIYISPGVEPANKTLVNIANNAAGPQIQVRSGSITFPTGYLTLGSSPNAFSAPITFNTPYLYTGGHLLVEIRQSGAGSNRAVDALGSTTAGSGTLYGGAYASTYSGATTGTNGNFAVIQFTYQTPLSIQLHDFSVRLVGPDAALEWFTAAEESNDCFVVEKSFDGKTFNPIATVAGSGTSSEKHRYEYLDKDVKKQSASQVFYRLQYTGKNGAVGYSAMRSLTLRSSVIGVTLFPNPVNSTASVGITVSSADNVAFNILDVTGRSVKAGSMLVSKGFNPVSFDVSHLPVGSYTLVLKAKNINETIRFSKN